VQKEYALSLSNNLIALLLKNFQPNFSVNLLWDLNILSSPQTSFEVEVVSA
jgi:hypothetical protein